MLQKELKMKIYELKDCRQDFEYDDITIGRFSTMELAIDAKENVEKYVEITETLKEIKSKIQYEYRVFKNDYSTNFPEPILPVKPPKHPESLLRGFISAKEKFLKEGNLEQAEIYKKNYQDLCEENRRVNEQYNSYYKEYCEKSNEWRNNMTEAFEETLSEKEIQIYKLEFDDYELPLRIEEVEIEDESFKNYDLDFLKGLL